MPRLGLAGVLQRTEERQRGEDGEQRRESRSATPNDLRGGAAVDALTKCG
jgi:hypothetical protein